MDSDELNKWLGTHGNDIPDWISLPLAPPYTDSRFAEWVKISGKIIPYAGWFWRGVDFDTSITLGIMEKTPIGDILGFDESGKFDNPWVTLNETQTRQLKDGVTTIVEEPTISKLHDLFELMQSFLPKKN